MTVHDLRPWLPDTSAERIDIIQRQTRGMSSGAIADRLNELAEANRVIHEEDCFNLNPATNVMNPRAEKLLASGLGSRPSLGYPGDKYEMGLEAIEEIEVIAADLAAEIFLARYAEVRVASGALANLYSFMATTQPGDAIIAPPASVGGHVTHHDAGCAGLYGLEIHTAPVDADGYTIDLTGLRDLANRVRPKLITIGMSLNLFQHPVREIRSIADEVGAHVLFDAAHQCGMIAGGVFSNPLDEGAHLMTMSTYKSLGGPAGGLIVTNEADVSEKLDAIAFPGLTANFDVAKTAALAMSLLDWRDFGPAYSQAMVETATKLAEALAEKGLPVFKTSKGYTASHQFALEAAAFGGGQAASKKLRDAGFLACGIGLPIAPVDGDMNGLRFGTPELVRWGMTAEDMPRLAELIAEALRSNEPTALAGRVAEWRRSFDTLHFVHG
ncbi:MAG: aminotransferase class I/II-fold pyridoxal phosphate-dependent enzyme [Roseibium sp.]|uniref:serine hydroxymethyltransferase n=1 Tax=Roseibium sp. TaxID=1936156 RepID=UPI001B11FDAF|nr:aminotransferase class I/II-fold pyridoxal phosphate-dependent enzyme [Roseibium sp.]MBO6890902.1 aminotransferase class I/II-fold pyridoxal phosphate-dependent enzyme [Roseibium sp.]MBO6929749.1 aminotransferase class I/II-fold pyridoxal phosphate-dependent enzyme [Roseibium sp.]